jgi:IAA-amino acid hydrolase
MMFMAHSHLEDDRRRVDAEVDQIATRLSAMRRHLHENPELSSREFATTTYVARQLAGAQVQHRLARGKRGVVTAIAPAREARGPVVARRADNDALPIAEEGRKPYRSRQPGIMHACGHDAHTAMLLGATLALHRAGPLEVGWRSIFQPEEEHGHGALSLVRQGALDGVQSILAFHVDPALPVGQACITAGPQTAFCQDFTVSVRGKGGHGARPHLTIDPIAAAAQLITLLYQAVPRQNDARDPLVLTIGSIQSGHANNVIPELATLKGTIRSFAEATSLAARETVERVCAGISKASRAGIRVEFDRLLPGVINDAKLAARCITAARELLGEKNVVTERRPSLGAEDFADYLGKVPGCMMLLGTRGAGKKVTPLHTPTFDIDEKALAIGARLLTHALLHLGREDSTC